MTMQGDALFMQSKIIDTMRVLLAKRLVLFTVMLSTFLYAGHVCAYTSKIGVNCLSGDTGTTKKLIDTGKMPILTTGIGERSSLIPYYKQRCPNGIVVVGLVGGASVDYNQNPVTFAQNRWNNYLWPQLSQVTSQQKALIDYVEVSPNMNEPHTVSEAQWWNAYADTLLPLVANAGFKPLVFTSGVGGVPTDDSVLTAMLPMFRKAHQYGGGWAYHGYTIYYTKDIGVEIWYGLRYRQVYDFFRRSAPDLLTMPLAIAEGGVDYLGNPATDGYAYRGTREQYADWLYWYDQKLKEDSYVLGVSLFKIGDNPKSWPSFDLDPMVPWMIHYYETGDPSWPRPKMVLGMHVLSEKTISDAVRTVCNAPAPIMYADASELKAGRAIALFKQANPNGIVIVGMRSRLPYPEEPNPESAANKRWTAISKVLNSFTSGEKALITYIDASPGPVRIDNSEQAAYFATYMRVLREKLSQNGFKSIIGAFDPSTLPTNKTAWDLLQPYRDVWYEAGRAGCAAMYQTGVTSYVKSTSAQAEGLLKYRDCYSYLLKYYPWMVVTPIIVMIGDGQDLKTIPDAFSRRTKEGLGQFTNWAEWADIEINKDPDVLGALLFKVGAPYAYPASDLGNAAEWFAEYVQERTSR